MGCHNLLTLSSHYVAPLQIVIAGINILPGVVVCEIAFDAL
jgi:hypothetical protein